MLSIGKLSAGQESYYEQQVAQGRDDYYTGKGEAAGSWRGRGAAELGLEGDVDSADFAALMNAKGPDGGALIEKERGGTTVAAYDLTFSAPKSVSVLYAVADRDTSEAIREAHDESVGAALDYLEREACQVRRGAGGSKRLAGEGFASATYRHRMSRAQDPQLHTHVVTANLAKGSDGRYSRLDGRALYANARAAGYLYEAHLRAAVRERLSWVRWSEPHKGIAEIEGVPAGVIEEFSQRRRAIDEWLAEHGKAGRRWAERAALRTREAKGEPVSTESWREAACARAAEHGLGRAELSALSRGEARPTQAVNVAALAEEFSGPAGLTETQNTFFARDAVIAFAGADRDGSPAAVVEERAGRYLRRPQVIALDVAGERQHTTADLLEHERAIVQSAENRRAEGAGELRERGVERALAEHPVALTDEQRAAVLSIATSPHGVEHIEALAGSGKTTLAGALREIYEAHGYRVLGTAPTARAARELSERAGISESYTLARLRIDLERYGGFGSGPLLLLLDEAGLASTREAAAVFAAAERSGVKLIAMGDSGQLASVRAGGWLGSLTRRYGAHRLTEVMRQRDPAERRALAAVHDGRPRSYLDRKLRSGELRIYVDAAEAERGIIARWFEAARRLPEGQAVMIARTNERRERLNAAAREELRASGRLGESIEIAGREFCVGDRVIARRNDRFCDLDNGMRATVRAIDRKAGSLVVTTDASGERALPAAYVAEHVEHAYALTGHGMQGGTVEWVEVIGAPDEFSRNWSYTALSRAREHTLLSLVDEAPRSEVERVEIAPADRAVAKEPVERLERRMRVRDDEDLALDWVEPPALPGGRERARAAEPLQERGAMAAENVAIAARPTDELCRELSVLDAALTKTPSASALGWQLGEARKAAELAERSAARSRERLDQLSARRESRRSPELGFEGERLAFAERRALKARERERDLIAAAEREPRRTARERALSARASELRGELARRRERHLEAALATPAAHITEALGARPADARRSAAWERGARAIEGYRFEHGVGGADALGPRPRTVEQRDAWSTARRALGVAQRELGIAHAREIEHAL